MKQAFIIANKILKLKKSILNLLENKFEICKVWAQQKTNIYIENNIENEVSINTVVTHSAKAMEKDKNGNQFEFRFVSYSKQKFSPI